ncbi:MAG: hypothetical protein IIA59_02965 [Candidatus Marinimicrobia bacterium]|nr:hypothetical protein [Candidatus Neomarinimicrobiota bacterium]
MIFASLVILVSSLGAQDTEGQREAANRQLYLMMYNTAMSDSVISVDERMQLETLQQALGLNIDIMEDMYASPALPLEPRLDQSGRWTLMAQNMAWGSGLYGFGIPLVLDVNDGKWYLAGFMFGLGGAMITTWNYTSGLHFPEGRSMLQRSGGTIGMHYGIALAQLIDVEARGSMAITMAAVPAGIYVGDMIFRKWDPTTGMAYAMSTHAELGRFFFSTLHRQLAAPPVEPQYTYGNYYTYDEETQTYYFDQKAWDADRNEYNSDLDQYNKKFKSWRNLRNLFMLSGYPVGFYLGQRLYGQRDYSFGDAALIMVGRWGGALYGLITADLLEMEFDEQAMGWRWMIIGGGMGGLYGMDRWIEGSNYSFGQAFLMSLGALAGAGFSMGVGVILEVDDLKFYQITGMAGALGGMAWVKANVNPGLERASSGIHRKRPVQLSMLPMAGSPGRALPGLTLQLRW